MGEVHGEGVNSGSDIFIDNQHNFKQGRMSGLRGADVRGASSRITVTPYMLCRS